MNIKARELGMFDASFFEPSGLNADNVASASDVAILLEEAMKHKEIVDAVNLPSYTLATNRNQEKIWNTNWLLMRWVPHHFSSIIGGKTGYIPESGYNFAMQVEQDGRTLTVVILGADSNEARFTEARDIAEWVYANYEWPDTVTK
jgi:D-alanyl-D-alanine carboxypeptidase